MSIIKFNNIELFGGLGLSLVTFSLYNEYKVGNICWRQDDTGNKKFNLYFLLKYIISPLRKSELWNYEFLFQNFFYYTSLTLLPFSYFLYNLPKLF